MYGLNFVSFPTLNDVQNLAVTETECESVTLQNAELVRELQMYKSAAVPLETKPRTMVTRVSRPPLVALNQSARPPPPPPACFTLSTMVLVALLVASIGFTAMRFRAFDHARW